MNQDNNHSPNERRESKTVFIPEPVQEAPKKNHKKAAIIATLLGLVGTFCLIFFAFTWGNSMSDANEQQTTETSTSNDDKPIPAPTKGLEYTLAESKDFYIVSGIGTETDTDIVIPETYKDLPVTEIGTWAFKDCTELSGITIPDSVTSIGNGAFYGCTSLTSITIPNSVTSIGGSAFYGCTGLTSVTIGNSVTSIGDYAFYNCTGLTSVTIGNSVTSIGVSAFKGCTGLTSITLPDSVTSIGISAFASCPDLSTVYYTGTASKWNAISGSSELIDATIYYYRETPPIESGNYWHYVDGVPTYWDINEYYTFTLLGDDTYSIAAKDVNNMPAVVIVPATYDGKAVTSIGDDAFAYCSSLTSITIPNSITNISDDAFYNCTGLKSITIPDSVTNIGNSAFRGCTRLTSITIPDSVTSIGGSAFCGCTRLTSITIPDSVTSIGEYAFDSCTNLKSITIPNNVTSIGDNAFYGCTNLSTVYYVGTAAEWSSISIDSTGNSSLTPATIYYYSETRPTEAGNYWHYVDGVPTAWNTDPLDQYYTFTLLGDDTYSIAAKDANNMPSEVVIPATYNGKAVTSIGENAFYNCTSLTSITIPDSVTSIGNYAFYGCKNLTSITIPDSVTSIGTSAFSNCTSLTSITIPDSVTSIGYSVFYGCTGLTSVTIPDSVTSIGSFAFSNCTSLTSITIPDSVTSIGYSVFYGCTSLTSITIPYSVTSIGVNLFSNCLVLTSITVDSSNTVYHSDRNCLIETASKTLIAGCQNSVIPTDGSVTSIGDSAFEDCTGLTSITIPDSVTSIGDSAFEDCTGLTSITIPDSVTSIGGNSFSNCSKLSNITVDLANPVYHSNGNCLIETASKTLIAGCKSSVIPTDGSVTSIGNYSFHQCKKLTDITIPKSVTSIDNYAFEGCFDLSAVYYTGTAAEWSSISIDSTGNSSLTSAIIYYYSENEPDEAGNYWHYVDGIPTVWKEFLVRPDTYFTFTLRSNDTYSIKAKDVNSMPSEVVIPATYNGKAVTSIISSAFSGCTNITSITIPDSVTSIGGEAFYNCTGLTSITMPDSVTSIGYSAFYGCRKLTSITIPDSVTSIGHGAFRDCTSLTSITIPDSVTSIGDYAFYNCMNLSTVYYTGMAEEWNVISINSTGNSYLTSAIRYYYSETEPTDTTNKYWHYVDGIPTPW